MFHSYCKGAVSSLICIKGWWTMIGRFAFDKRQFRKLQFKLEKVAGQATFSFAGEMMDVTDTYKTGADPDAWPIAPRNGG